jgi:hypothetical protein
VNTVLNIRVPYYSGKLLSSCTTGSFSRRTQLNEVSYIYVVWAITNIQAMLSSVCSLIPFCGVMNSCGEIIVYVVYVVSCVRISLLPAMGYCGCSCSTVLLLLVTLWVLH